MIKKTTFIFIILSFLKISSAQALNSSSYLVSKLAFQLNDFETVSKQYQMNYNFNLNDYRDQMISFVILGNYKQANKISLLILKIDPQDQEAILVNLAFSLLNNVKKKQVTEKYKSRVDEFINFIFFEDDKLKSFKDISDTFIEIVQSSFYDYNNLDNLNYNFLLFYLSLSSYFDKLNNQALFLKAQTYQMMKNYDKAIYFYSKIESESDFFNDAQYYLAYNYERTLPFTEAENKIKEIVNSSSDNLSVLKILANFYRLNQEYEIAIKYYTDIIKKEKPEGELWYYLYLRGICFERNDNWDLAEKDFLHSIEIKNDSADVLNYLAYGWIEQNKNFDISLKMLIKANNLDPTSYYILDSLAWAYYKTNNLKLAAELMEEVVEMSPGEAISLDHLGDIYYALDRKREASFFWKQAKDLAEPEDDLIQSIDKKLSNYYAG